MDLRRSVNRWTILAVSCLAGGASGCTRSESESSPFLDEGGHELGTDGETVDTMPHPDDEGDGGDATTTGDGGGSTTSGDGDSDGSHCPPVAAALVPGITEDFTAPYQGVDPYLDPVGQSSGGWDTTLDGATNWRWWSFDNWLARGSVTFTLHSWRLRADDGQRAYVGQGNTGSSVIAISLAPCPGQFLDLPPGCTGRHGSLVVTTEADGVGCHIEPDVDYYLNAAAFDLDELTDNGVYLPVEPDPCRGGATCSWVDLWQVQISPL